MLKSKNRIAFLFFLLVSKMALAQDCGPIVKNIDLGGNERVWASSRGKDQSIYLAGGTTRSFGAQASFIIKTSEKGDLLWSRVIPGDNFEFFRSVVGTADSGAIAVGVSKRYPLAIAFSALVVKWDKNGAVQWSKAFRTNQANADYANGVIETSDGGYLVTGTENAGGFTARGLAIKLTKSGSAQWIKLYDAPEGTDLFTAVETIDGFVMAGDYLTSGNTTYRPCVVKVNKNNGNVLALKSWRLSDDRILNYGYIKTASNGFVLSCGNLADLNTLGNTRQVVLSLNAALDLTQAVRINHAVSKNSVLQEVAALNDGSVVSCGGGDNPGDDADMYQISAAGNVLWKTRIGGAGSQNLWTALAVANNAVVFGGATTNSSGELNILWVRQTIGATSNICNFTTSDAATETFVLPIVAFQYDAVINGNSNNWVDVNVSVETSGTVISSETCPAALADFSFSQNSCNPLEVKFAGGSISGTEAYWSFGDGATATGTANPNHVYTAYGNYTIKYKPSACADTITKIISLVLRAEDIVKTNDTVLCDNGAAQLRSDAALEYCWSPATYLDNPNIQSPTARPLQNILYRLNTKTVGNNLIVNGNFSAGNTGFTSAYSFASNNTTEGQYFVGSSPQAWNAALSNCGDHTNGTGSMLLVNGSPTPDVVVWQQSIAVQPNTNYEFSTWLQALWPPNPAQLQFAINGIQIGNIFNAQLPTCTWLRFNTVWNSGANTTAVISIQNKNTAIQGNDFALDDLSFAPVVYKTDSVRITLSKATIQASPDTVGCGGTQINLNASGGVSYQWLPTAGLSNAASASPVATLAAPIQYVVTGTDAAGCTGTDTVNIGVLPAPTVGLSPGDTALCPGNRLQLNATGGSSYRWSPAASLNDANLPNPMATPGATTRYRVVVTGANGCTASDSTLVAVKAKPVFGLVPDSIAICAGKTATLNATGGDLYQWQPAAGLSAVDAPQVVATPTASTVYTVRITSLDCNDTALLRTTVNVNANPVLALTKSNDITCTEVQAQLTATGAQTYAWQPAPGLSNYSISNPVASPVVTTTYAVLATGSNGCTVADSITVAFSATGDGRLFQMPNAFTPNGDGNNDCFGIRKWGNVAVQYFQVFNRWGQLLFTGKQASDCWNGNFNGAPQPGGNYVYRVLVKTACGEISKEGSFVLIR
jgi:gliding motility-associated-like protein